MQSTGYKADKKGARPAARFNIRINRIYGLRIFLLSARSEYEYDHRHAQHAYYDAQHDALEVI